MKKSVGRTSAAKGTGLGRKPNLRAAMTVPRGKILIDGEISNPSPSTRGAVAKRSDAVQRLSSRVRR